MTDWEIVYDKPHFDDACRQFAALSKPVTDLVFEHENGEIADWDAFNATIADAVKDVVQKQVPVLIWSVMGR